MGNDCGSMAIAFAYTLCSGGDPTKVRYSQESLRQEIVNPFVKGNIYISAYSSVEEAPGEHSYLQLVCNCRLNYLKKAEGEAMMICDSCFTWFHKCCQKVNDAVFATEENDEEQEYECSTMILSLMSFRDTSTIRMCCCIFVKNCSC